MRQDFNPALATTIRPFFAIATRCLKTSGVSHANGFSGSQTARYSSESGSSIKIVPVPIRTQPRAHVPIALPQAFVIAANWRSARIDAAAAGTGVKTVFAQFAGRFRQFGDLENLATKAAFAAGFSWDCKHER